MKKLGRILALVLIFAAIFTFMGAARQTAFAQSCGPSVTHVVQPGENLFRISLNHGTTFTAVAAANGISNVTRIYPGQVLVMVCPGGATAAAGGQTAGLTTNVVFPPPPLPGQTIAVPVIPPSVDCTGFRVTQPMDGFAPETQVFYWNGAPGATSYRVSIFNADLTPGALVAAQDVPGPLTTTSMPVGPGYIGPGFRFSFRIQALVADTVVCSTPLITLYRSVQQLTPPTAAPPPPIP
jgi:hypothetical protein